tara:strand:- start:1819 stop:2574 length:756 start_codon:yes stop_codon:yes gene_type:complete
MNICFCSDEKLVEMLPVVINSIASSNEKLITIHYIHCINNKYKLEKLQKFVNKFKHLRLIFYYKSWDYQYKGLTHVTNATMLRLFIPEILSCEKVIYLDIDLIVNIDLSLLYEIDCGITGIAIKNAHDQHWEKIHEDENLKWGNCGVIVMELNMLRKNNFTQTCLNIHSEYPDKHDQFIINKYANGKHSVLEPRFNVFWNKDDHILDSEKHFIFHFLGDIKPYYYDVGKFQYLWEKNKIKENTFMKRLQFL